MSEQAPGSSLPVFTLECNEVGRTRDFYACLGLDFKPLPEGGGAAFVADLDGARLELRQGPLDEWIPRFEGFDVGIPDVPKALARLGGAYSAFVTDNRVTDPDGRRVRLLPFAG